MSNLNKKIFKDKTYSDLFQEIYDNQKKKEKQITALINELKPLINDISDATMLVPLIKEYMELGIKNDDVLIKMATIFQRLVSATASPEGGDYGLSQEEKEQLLAEVKKIGLPSGEENNDK